MSLSPKDFMVAEWLPEYDWGGVVVKRERVLSTQVIEPGLYSSLHIDGERWMDDMLPSVKELWDFVPHARGHVAITGLGLGVLPGYLVRFAEMESLTVIEQNRRVIEAVGGPLHRLADQYGQRFTIVQGDAYKPSTTVHYDVAFHDIWLGPPTQAEVQALLTAWGPLASRQWYWGGHAKPCIEYRPLVEAQ